MSDATRLLASIREGHLEAGEELLCQLYQELRRLAADMLANKGPGQALQPMALVQEAWLRLSGRNGPHCPNRAYFFAAAGEAMRRILVEGARHKNRSSGVETCPGLSRTENHTTNGAGQNRVPE